MDDRDLLLRDFTTVHNLDPTSRSDIIFELFLKQKMEKRKTLYTF
jgi:hypothetical protein